MTGLLDHHRKMLEQDSAISADVVAQRGYYSIETKKELVLAGGPAGRADHLPAVVIPIYNVVGDLAYNVIRFDDPPIVEGRARKYLIPHRAHAVVDVPRQIVSVLGDPGVDLYVTEGSKKVDALLTAGVPTVGLIGVWSWRGTNAAGGKALLADFEAVAFNGRTIHVIFDSDVMLKEGVRLALERFREVARHRGASVVLYYLPGAPDGSKVGVDDFLAAGGTIGELQRYATFELLKAPGTESRAIPDTPKVPAPPTDELVEAISAYLRRFVVWPSDHALLAVTLWVAHTWAFSVAAPEATPYLAIVSPEKGSGKSRVLEVCETIVCNPLRTGQISAAAIYQAVEAKRPTLLIDEIDAIFGGRGDEATQALRGVINAGNRPGSPVLRGTQDMEVREYDVYCPKALAGINDGSLPDTIADRTITIRMQRARRDERLERWRRRREHDVAEQLRDQLYAWATEHGELLAEYEVPAGLLDGQVSDRAEDGWEPLLAVAELAGVTTEAVAAAVHLEGQRVESAEDRAHALFVAVYRLLTGKPGGTAFTKTIITDLNEDFEAGIREAWRGGNGPTAYTLRQVLGARYAIQSKTLRIGSEKRKGYDLADFKDPWARYGQPAEGEEDGAVTHTPEPSVASVASPTPATDATDATDAPGGTETPSHTPALATSTCAYPGHRASDYHLPGGSRWICGTCHPPALPHVAIIHRNGAPAHDQKET